MRESDGALVEAILAGQPELFRELVRRHAASVFRVIRAAVRQEADAEDVGQEVFLASFLALPRLRDSGRYRAHLMAIAARKAADYLRRRGSQPLPLDEEPAAPVPREDSDLLAVVRDVVDSLPAESRLIFALRHHEGYSCVQIASLLDRPEGTIYSRLSRIHAAIRRAAEVRE